MTDIDPLTAAMYADGRDGLQIAETIITCSIAALLEVRASRATNPNSYPGYPTDAAPHTAARMITAHLLDAGWRPPDTQATTAPDVAPDA